MKKLFRISAAIVAALVSLAACQKANEVENQAPKLTHSVKFTTDLPTKTSYDIEGTTVNYKWEDSDLNRLHVYEDGVEGTINVEGSAIDENYVMLTVNFEGSGEGVHTYTANLNEGIIKSNQVADGKYDSDCDVLVAKPVSSDEIVEDYYTFRFRRPVAITELKLKNLKAEEKVSKVTIVSDAVHPLVGTYTQSETDAADGTWGEKSNKIVVTFGTEQDGETPKTKTVESDGSLVVPIVSMPVENASVKVLVETENGLKYRKVTSAALTLTANNVKSQGIGLTQVTEAEHAEDGWYLVTDASELFDGDEIRIACTSENKMAGDLAIKDDKTQTYLANYEVSFQDGKLTGVTPGSEPQIFTLYEGYDKWNITTANGKLGATAVKTLKYDDGTLDWGIGIGNEGVATISSATDGYGAIKYNASSPRFLNYASGQTDIQIFKKYGDAVDPVIKTARTASFSPEAATVTIDANNNVFPELSFDPADATDGEQTWTSSKPDVATVNETTGEVTLVSDGTTTISVKIAETDTYQPCNASYVLTVKPAEEEGVDYLDWAFTNVTSYANWENTGSASGNTYAGQSTKFKSDDTNNKDRIDAIQMRTTNSNSGIVVTLSKGKVAKKVAVEWNSYTSNKTLDIYGKSSVYSSAADLYSSTSQGTKLGSIIEGTSTELEISGDYEYIGIRSNNGALYLNWIKIQWEDAKPEYEACFKNAGGTVVTEVNATVGEVFTAPTLYKGATPGFANAYESSNTEVATVDAQGAITLKKKGDAIITATLEGDETHKTTKVSYTLHVANKLSSIKLADDSEQPTTFYVGQDFSFTGIKLEAEYNDGEKKTLTADDLTADNFSGFDSSAAVESQTITVSYTDEGTTKTTTYNIEIKPSVTLYGITVPEPVDGNSITVKGGLTKAAEGDEIELDVNLVEGYKLTSLKVNDVEHSSDVAEGKYTFTMPAAAVTVTAVFDNHYNVTIEQPSANGTVKVQNATASSQSIAYGTSVSVLAEPATGYELDSWTVTGAELADATSASTSFTMPANDVNITASFKKHVETQTIAITKSSSGITTSYTDPTFTIGTVTFNAKQWMSSTDFIQAKASQNPSVYNSTPIPGIIKKITVVTGSGKTARAVTVYGGSSSSQLTDQITSPTTAMTMVFDFTGKSYSYFKLVTPGNACYFDNITIEYEPGDVPEPTKYEVNIASGIKNGTVTATPTSASAGSTVTLTVTPDSGYALDVLTVTDASSNPVTVTDNKFMMPASAVTVSATFKESSPVSGDTYTKITSLSGLTTGDYVIVGAQKAAGLGELTYGTLSSGRIPYTQQYTSAPASITKTSDDGSVWHVTVSETSVTLYNNENKTYIADAGSGKLKYANAGMSFTADCKSGVFSLASGTYFLCVNSSSGWWRNYAASTGYNSGVCLYFYKKNN